MRVILDKSNEHEGYSASKFLQHEGVPVMIDSAHNIAHNKVMIVDGETVITGSFNFTKSGEDQNAENLVVIRDASIATTYMRNWNDHLAHSHPPGAIARDTVRPKIVAGQVVGNRSTRIFAWPGCASFDTMIPGHRVVFENRQAAEAPVTTLRRIALIEKRQSRNIGRTRTLRTRKDPWPGAARRIYCPLTR